MIQSRTSRECPADPSAIVVRRRRVSGTSLTVKVFPPLFKDSNVLAGFVHRGGYALTFHFLHSLLGRRRTGQEGYWMVFNSLSPIKTVNGAVENSKWCCRKCHFKMDSTERGLTICVNISSGLNIQNEEKSNTKRHQYPSVNDLCTWSVNERD